MKKTKSYQLVAYLIKTKFKDWKDCLKDEQICTFCNLSPRQNMLGKIVIGERRERPPRWLSFLQEGTEEEITSVYNASTRALLFLNCEERLFAISFGHGYHMLKDDCYERGFGLKVALNTIDPLKLRSVDISNIEEQTVQTRKQTSKSSSMDAFGVDIVRDLMRAVTGEPLDQTLAKKITGRDALAFNSKISFSDLNERLSKFLAAYHSEKYKEHFHWIDNLSEVKDPTVMDMLNELLIDALKKGELDNIHLAPPEIIDWSSVEGFKYSTNKSSDDIYPDLEVIDFLDTIETKTLDLMNLKKVKVLMKRSTAEEPFGIYKLYDSIVFETVLEEDLYVLTMGKWFKVETNFATKVSNYIKKIPDAEIEMPDCLESENETQYNERAANEMKNTILMHEKLIKSDVGGNRIELCDLFTEKGQFIHVKAKGRSSTLSHLFAQGRVSAEIFLQDQNFRIKARQRVFEEDKYFAKHFPDAKPEPGNYEIVFAFIDKSLKPLSESLPFFTKLNFMQTTGALHLLGFEVSKIKIPKVELHSPEKKAVS